jgi:hypothetical protein
MNYIEIPPRTSHDSVATHYSDTPTEGDEMVRLLAGNLLKSYLNIRIHGKGIQRFRFHMCHG